MCLYKDKKYHPFNHPLIAEKDIVCYKILRINYITNMFDTLYTYSTVPKECLENKVPFKAEILNKFRFICRHVLGFSNIVTDGFIHTYSLSIPNRDLVYSDGVFKCIIPKGTKYFIGKKNDYASERIIFTERLY